MTSKDTNPKDAIGTKKWRQFTVVPFQVIWEVGVGMLEGALKYGRHNYRASGVRASVYVDAALGHIHQFWEGEDIDPDSTAHLHHITKAITSLTVLRDAMMNDFYVDDRPPRIKDMDGVRTQLQSAVEELFKEHADKNPHHYTEVEDGSLKYREPSAGELVIDPTAYEWPDLLEDGPLPREINMSGVTSEEQASRMFQSLFGALPDGYTIRSQRIGDIEITTIAPPEHPWNATDEDFENDEILATASGSIEFTLGELEVGKTYQYHRNHLGDLVTDGGIWTVKALDHEGRPLGVKPHYAPDHRGVTLSSGWWIQVPGPDAQVNEKSLMAMREQFLHAQSSASITPPVLGLSAHALALLDGWRTRDTGQTFDPETPKLARALALRQWGVAKGII